MTSPPTSAHSDPPVSGEPTAAPPAPRRPRTSILNAVLWFALSYGVAIVAYLVVNAVASRWLGTAAFGYFVVATTIATGVGQFGLLGAHRAGLRDAAVMEDSDDVALGGLRGNARAAMLVSVPVTSLVAALVAFVVVGDGRDFGDRLVLAAAFGGLVYASALQKLWANYLRGLGRVRLASLLEGRSGGALVAVSQALFLALGWWLLSPTGLTGSLLAATAGFLVPVVVLGAVVQRSWAHLDEHPPVLASLRRAVRRNWRFAVNQLAVYVGAFVELIIATVLLSADDTSLFSSAMRMAMLLLIPLTSLQVVFAPVAARLLAQREAAQLERLMRTGSSVAASAALVLWVPCLVAPTFVLGLVYPPSFAAAAPLLVALTAGSAVSVVCGMSGTVLTMSRREGVAAAVQSIVVVARVVVGGVAALLWGVEGLAISSALLSTVLYVVMWTQAARLIGVRTHATLRPDLSLLRSIKS